MLKIILKKPIGFETLCLGRLHIFSTILFVVLILDFRYALVLEDKAAKKAADSSKPENGQIGRPKAEAESVRYLT